MLAAQLTYWLVDQLVSCCLVRMIEAPPRSIPSPRRESLDLLTVPRGTCSEAAAAKGQTFVKGRLRQCALEGLSMSSITIRNLEPGLKERLRVRAAKQGHSMEAEARRILTTALKASEHPAASLYERIRARVEPIGGIDLDLPPRDPAREPPRFD